jgi:hypothetical protein
MNELRSTLLSLLAVVFVLGAGIATAQDNVYDVGYFANAVDGAPAAHLRLTNDGDASAANLCANVYVFDNTEEMHECCSCQITSNGYLDLTVSGNLVSNPLDDGPPPTRGIIKVVSGAVPSSGTCDPTTETAVAGIKGWLTHVQKGAAAGAYNLTDTALTDATLSSTELNFNLELTCFFVHWLGSPTGVCSCTDAGD